jgi:hypothetical protein
VSTKPWRSYWRSFNRDVRFTTLRIEHRALFMQLLAELERDGCLPCCESPVATHLARRLSLPLHVVTTGLPLLVARGLLALDGVSLRVPGFIPIPEDGIEVARLRALARRRSRSFVFERAGHRCAYCGAQGQLTIDHVVPLSRGGDNNQENLAAACRPCNASKKDRTPAEWRRS